MKKQLILALILLLISTLSFFIGFIAGGTHQARIQLKNSLLMDSNILKLYDLGMTNRANNALETVIMNQLWGLEAISNKVLSIKTAFNIWENSSRWQAEYKWAYNRVNPQRERATYLLHHPSEAAKSFESTFEETLKKSGRSNANVTVTGADKNSIKMEVEGFSPKRQAQQSASADGEDAASKP